MKRLELLIEEARSLSGNTRYDNQSGLSQNDFVRFLQNAQDYLFSQISQTKPRFFLDEMILNVVSGQETYDLSTALYLGNIETVEYSATGTEENYYPLDVFSSKNRMTKPTSNPSGYIRRNQSILLVPPPTTGKLRVSFLSQLPQLDIRRGRVQAVVIGSGQINNLTLTVSGLDATELNKHNYLCIVDRDGNLKVRNVEFDVVNAATGSVTLTNPHTFLSGESVNAGDYVVRGKNTSNLPSLPDTCERFFVEYATFRAKLGNSSQWSTAVKAEVDQMLADIVGTFKDIDEDPTPIPLLDSSYLCGDE